MDAQRKLFERYLKNECTVDELKSLTSLFALENEGSVLKQIILEKLAAVNEGEDLAYPGDPGIDLDRKQEDIYLSLRTKMARAKPSKLWPIVSIAASLFLVLSLGTYFLLQKEPNTIDTKPAIATNEDVNTAILTLSDGRKVVMDSSRRGQIASQGQVKIVNGKEGLNYIGGNNFKDGNKVNDETIKNKLSTGKKHQYALQLSDGTKVWLNALSSISFPTAFSKNARNVELDGEAYFEVSHDASRPFQVNSGKQTVRVLGTKFVVNSYTDEPVIKTTLIVGSVKVYNREDKIYKLLVPGQQSSNDGKNIVLSSVDPLAAIAWKNQLFQFVGADLKSVMREFSRWYDLDVVYEGNISQADEFTGKIPRNADVKTVLKVLNAYGIRVRMEGKNLVVSAR